MVRIMLPTKEFRMRRTILTGALALVLGTVAFAAPAAAATGRPIHIPLDDNRCASAQNELTHYTMLQAGLPSNPGLYDYAIAYWEDQVGTWC